MGNPKAVERSNRKAGVRTGKTSRARTGQPEAVTAAPVAPGARRVATRVASQLEAAAKSLARAGDFTSKRLRMALRDQDVEAVDMYSTRLGKIAAHLVKMQKALAAKSKGKGEAGAEPAETSPIGELMRQLTSLRHTGENVPDLEPEADQEDEGESPLAEAS